ncbi:hypothetical protein K525DRAFT_186582 [Schizophyllum commune Loenen D]|nr:hypothetical protein K525DRAFT_186582 [Schizophyllum commune Loenen D]
MGARRYTVLKLTIKDVCHNAQSSPTSSESSASLPSPTTRPPETEYAMSHWRTQLHNRVAAYGWSAPSYEYITVTSGGATRWVAIVCFNSAEWGRAEESTRNAAADLAAKNAWQNLNDHGYSPNY